ncbi:hypothetical protein [Ancylobacter mangrovi]|uniref:hypothetical protein n=1 Tax=Ancylobacter mangrovi TaxID=2972472 RepID=UPI002162A358|nr:hypothetical protein [Ancylobacter mangrovi]
MFAQSYDPETVTLLEQVLDEACAWASAHAPLNNGIRTMLASAVLEGAKLGLRERDELLRFAWRAPPWFRHGYEPTSPRGPAPPRWSRPAPDPARRMRGPEFDPSPLQVKPP